jgi:hypothetical protein
MNDVAGKSSSIPSGERQDATISLGLGLTNECATSPALSATAIQPARIASLLIR